MITSAISVGSDMRINYGNGPTYGILVALLFSHAIVCSAATKILARLNIAYVIINSKYSMLCERLQSLQWN